MTTTAKLAADADVLEETSRSTSLPVSARRTLVRVASLLRGETYLTTGQAGERLGVGSINTVKRLAEDGRLKGAFRNERGTWQIPLSAVIDLEKDREHARVATLEPAKAIRAGKKPSHRLSL
jgi:hypothetical protein